MILKTSLTSYFGWISCISSSSAGSHNGGRKIIVHGCPEVSFVVASPPPSPILPPQTSDFSEQLPPPLLPDSDLLWMAGADQHKQPDWQAACPPRASRLRKSHPTRICTGAPSSRIRITITRVSVGASQGQVAAYVSRPSHRLLPAGLTGWPVRIPEQALHADSPLPV